ncbi:MAG: zinc ribbon domain-containing protein [Desulfosarcinaceae bacterium]|jgi:putative FmdB family regulatory protein
MPIYEYQCSACGKIEEALQKVSDAPLTTCPHCSGKLNKLISHSTFHLKGSGWYVTDYADKGKTSPGAAADKGSQNTSPPSDKPKATEAKTDTATKGSES